MFYKGIEQEAYDYTVTLHIACSLNHGTVNNHRRHLLRLQSILIQSGERESEMVRLKEKKNSTKEENISHPSRYILQTTKHCSGATIRGQALSQDHPFPPSIPSSIPPSTRYPQSTAEGKTYTMGSTQ